MSAVEKIEAQQKGRENTAVWMVGEQLKEICLREPESEELLDRDLDVKEMSLTEAEKKIRAWADEQHRKMRTENCVAVPPNVAEKILRTFYGLPERSEKPAEKPAAEMIRLEDFL